MSVYQFIDRRALETGKTVALFALLGVVVFQPVWLTTIHKQRERFIILNGAGSYTVAPALSLDEASDLHEDCAFQAARAAFSRNPEGPDRPSEIQRWFLSESASGGGHSAVGKIRAAIKAEEEEFRAKRFHQKMNITEPAQIVVQDEKIVKVTLTGQLIRTGVFRERQHSETRRFSIQLILVRNPNMMLNNRPPLAVWDFDSTLQ